MSAYLLPQNLSGLLFRDIVSGTRFTNYLTETVHLPFILAMGQLSTLIWKNFLYCKRHPIKIALFYLIPLIFCCLLFLILSEVDITNIADCDYETLVLPPSNLAFVLSSLVCSQLEKPMCKDTKYKPSHYLDETLTQMGNDAASRLCPGKSKNQTKMFLGKIMQVCEDRASDEDYLSTPFFHHIFRGKIFYYPKNQGNTSQVISIMTAYLDSAASMQLALKNVLEYYQNLVDNGYTPAENITQSMAALLELGGAVQCFKSATAFNRIQGFDTKAEALAAARNQDFKKDSVWGIVQFIETTEKHLQYKITANHNMGESLGTVYLQSLVEGAMIEAAKGSALPGLVLEQKLLPKRCHKDPMVYNISFMIIQLVLTFGFMMIAYTLTSEICFEKAAGLQEFLFIAAVPRWKIKLSWLIFGSTFCLILAFVISLIFKFSSSRFLQHSDFSLIWIFTSVYSLALLCMCFCVASLMSTAQKAGILMFVSLLASFLLPNWASILPTVGYSGSSLFMVKITSFFHSSVAAQVGYAYVYAWEKQDRGATWNNINQSPKAYDGYAGILEAFLYMIIQCPLYLLFSWYFDHVAPSKYGIKWPVYFCCIPSFWVGSDRGHNKNNQKNFEGARDQADIEPLNEEKKAGISIINLSKKYGKTKMAVDHLTITFYQNEITALLGHNGAGKSTTMNMLTGMISPSSGSAYIATQDIWTEMDDIRQTLGFCPQYDIIYPELSVQEHMKFYGQLKKIEKNQVDSYSSDLFKEMKMTHALKTPAAKLSGGMKRKLSIAIAFLGDPKTVILDEPTSAIDPFSRRSIWDVILRYRAKSTILISTHYMQEADVLGNRIAIMDEGRLKCFGTPMYLKNSYGSGSKITIAHDETFNKTLVTDALGGIIECHSSESSANETNYELSVDTARSPEMIQVFDHLEENKESYGVQSFGLSESTMEQVFFNVAEGGGTIDKLDDQSSKLNDIAYEKNAGAMLLSMQTIATWVKRFHLGRRSVLGLIFQIIAPLLFMVICLLITKSFGSSSTKEESTVHMHPWNTTWSNNKMFYSGPTGSFVDSMLEQGIGTKCIAAKPILNQECNSASQSLLPAETRDKNPLVQCDCNVCPDDAVGTKAKEITLKSGDKLVNLNGRNIASYLLKTSDTEFIGGIESDIFTSTSPFNYWAQLSIEIAQDINQAIEIWLFQAIDALLPSSVSVHCLWVDFDDDEAGEGRRARSQRSANMGYMKGSFLNAYSNVLVRATMADKDYGISYYLEEDSFSKDGKSESTMITGFLLGLFGSLALMMPTFNVLLVIVGERSAGNKQLQIIMGLNPFVYWIANFTWDVLLYVFSEAVMVAFMAIFPNIFKIHLGWFFVVGLLYGLSMILLSYNISFIFKAARTGILIIGMLAPFFSIAALVLMSFYLKSWYKGVDLILNFFPPYFIADGIAYIATEESTAEEFRRPMDHWDILGKRMLMSGIFSGIMLMLLTCFEVGLFSMVFGCCCNQTAQVKPQSGNKDPDVAREENRLLHQQKGGDTNSLEVKQLQKTFRGGKVAVKSVSFGVLKGECFGLLGVNGAGKTTLFQMLTRFHRPTRGDARILGHSIFSSSKVCKHMSYCPQQDVLFESLSPTEHLSLYARIRGVPGYCRDHVVKTLINEVGLSQHVKKQSQSLSGGNKRKLNFAIAVLDFPDVIFLDEMTTGMDPKARRAAWLVLEQAVNKKGCAAVITSHSMEECEALCKRIVIMVNGSFQCIGGVQYLKDRYGNSYNVKFKLGSESSSNDLKQKTEEIFSGATLVEEHAGFLEMQIPAEDLKLSNLFRFIHDNKNQFEVEEFSVSQTTLEHVFVNMVRGQE